MDGDAARQMAREYLDQSPGLYSDLGFEVTDTSRFDFKEWEVECRIFSTTFSKMVKYVVIIHDDVAIRARLPE